MEEEKKTTDVDEAPNIDENRVLTEEDLKETKVESDCNKGE